MGRAPRIDVAGEIYHVINRGNNRQAIFHDDGDYLFFEKLLFKTLEEVGLVCQAYVLMPNHWHLLLKTYDDGALSRCMQQLTQNHTQAVHVRMCTIGHGHLYQGRYKSSVIEKDDYYLSVLRYIERNPVRAFLSPKAEEWRWGSAYHRVRKTDRYERLNADMPLELPSNYINWVNDSTDLELAVIRTQINGRRSMIPKGSI